MICLFIRFQHISGRDGLEATIAFPTMSAMSHDTLTLPAAYVWSGADSGLCLLHTSTVLFFCSVSKPYQHKKDANQECRCNLQAIATQKWHNWRWLISNQNKDSSFPRVARILMRGFIDAPRVITGRRCVVVCCMHMCILYETEKNHIS
jgi:hypothetical protein